MAVKFKGFTFDNNVINTIENNCQMVGAHDFNNYIHNCSFAGKPIINVLKDLKKNSSFVNNNGQEKNLNLSLAEQINIIIKFYKSLNAKIGNQIEHILRNKDTRYCVDIQQDSSKPCAGGVSTQNGSNLIHININVDKGVHGLRILAHEMSHAISGFKTKSYEVLNHKNQGEADKYFKQLGNFSVDSIGEIESHIIELIFMEYLQNEAIINESDFNIFKSKRNNSFCNNLNTIIEESYILDYMPPPLTLQKFEQFEKDIGGIIKTKKYKTLMNRLIFMYQRDPHSGYSQYDFRYVIGEVVSSCWFDKYSTLSPNQKKEMINQYFEYLLATDKYSLETACDCLLGMKIGQTFNSYSSQIQLKTIK